MINTILKITEGNIIILIINLILSITGFLTIVISFISLFINHYEFDVNVFIDRIDKSEIIKYKNAIEYTDTIGNGEYLLFLPQGNTNFKNVKFCEYIYTGKKFKKGKILQCFMNINCTNGLIINTYFPCGAPGRILEWESEYGVKGKYIIAENGKDGDVKHGNFFYKYNLISNIRKIINWK